MQPKGLTARNSSLWAALPLRERNRAQTRLALLDAALAELATRPFAEVRVADLCRAAGTSEQTFFNHFAAKSELLLYFVQLWSLEAAWRARAFAPDTPPFEAIERVFAFTAAQVARAPRVMAEVVAHQATIARPAEAPEIRLAERILRLPGCDGVESLAALGIGAIVEHNLRRAAAQGLLDDAVDPAVLSLAVASVLLGTPAALGPTLHPQLAALWQAQLTLLWRAARRAGPTAPAKKKKKPAKPRA